MRVGINLTQFMPGKSGGVQTYAETLVRGLLGLRDGKTYVLFVNYHTLPLFEDLRDRCELVLVDVPVSRWTRRIGRFFRDAEFNAYARGLRRILVDARLDVLHFPLSFIVPFDYPGRTVVTFLDLQQEYFPQFFSAAEIAWRERHYRPSAARATHIITISAYTARSLEERYGTPRGKITPVHLAAGDDIRSPVPEGARVQDVPDRYFCYPAALWPHKNHSRMLQAVARLKEQDGFDLPLVLSGMDAADAGPVREEVARLGLGGQVQLLGYLPRESFRVLLHRAEFMIFPSLFEGFGLPVVEAMAVGCPVACSGVTSLPEIVGDDGYTFDPTDVGAIARAIRDLWRDGGLRQRLRERLEPRAHRFTNERMARETAAVYARVAGTRSAAPMEEGP